VNNETEQLAELTEKVNFLVTVHKVYMILVILSVFSTVIYFEIVLHGVR